MECERMRDALELYAGGRLEAEESARLETHLRECAACARQLRWVRALKTAVRGAPRPAMPAELRAALMRQIRGQVEQASAHGWRDWLDSWRWSWRLAAGFGCASAFAAAVAILAVGRMGNGVEELPLDDVLAAHGRYELTMPAANREAIFADIGRRLDQGGPLHD